MPTRFRPLSILAAALAVAALAGCGSSSKSKATNTTTPSTPFTATTSSTPSTSGLTNSTPIDSPQSRTFFIKLIKSTAKVPPGDAAKIADCIIQKLTGRGYVTFGDAGQHRARVQSDSAACTIKVLTGR